MNSIVRAIGRVVGQNETARVINGSGPSVSYIYLTTYFFKLLEKELGFSGHETSSSNNGTSRITIGELSGITFMHDRTECTDIQINSVSSISGRLMHVDSWNLRRELEKIRSRLEKKEPSQLTLDLGVPL